MTSTIYNHRSLQPSGPPSQPSGQQYSQARLAESMDTIKQEFDHIVQDVNMFRAQRDEFDGKIGGQINELTLIKQTLYDLEVQHSKVRQQYEDEIQRLRVELVAARSQAATGASGASGSGGGGGGGPGTVGVGPPANAVTPSGSVVHPGIGGVGIGTPGLPPPPPSSQTNSVLGKGPGPYGESPYDARYRERETDKEREWDRARERDRERERERERDKERERDRDRERDQRDVKRLKTIKNERDRDRLDYPPPGMPGEGPSTSQPPPPLPVPTPSSSANVSGGGSLLPPSSSSSSSTPGIGMGTVPGAVIPLSMPSPWPEDLDLQNFPSEYKKEGSDWFAVFNPKVKKVLDVSLVHTLSHESVVCCVKFSADGKFLATGCNRTAQIYDTKTGAKTCVLNDEGASKTGDLYIRSVCFSPDGKFLATGAEDKLIRIWDIAKKQIRNIFEGHQQEIYSLAFSRDGRLIISGSGDRTARIWDMESGRSKVLQISEPENVDAGVTSVAISPDGKWVAAGSLDFYIRIWDVSTGALVDRLKGHKDSVYSVSFTPDGRGLVSGSLDKTLKHWDLGPLIGRKGTKREGGGAEKSCNCTLNFCGHKDYVLSVAVSHDGQWVVSGSKDRGVQFWEQRSAQVQLMLQGHKNSVISIDLSPTGGILATGSGDWQARLWSYTTLS